MKPRICTQCGAPLLENSNRCEYCGTTYENERTNIIETNPYPDPYPYSQTIGLLSGEVVWTTLYSDEDLKKFYDWVEQKDKEYLETISKKKKWY